MQVKKLDHVNVHTANLAIMVEWYGRVLGMRSGERPPFPFPGAWLYCGGEPTVHLVGVDEQPEKPGKLPQLEHFAFSATGLKEFMGRLAARQGEVRGAQGAALGLRAGQHLGPRRQPHPCRLRARGVGRRRAEGGHDGRHALVQERMQTNSSPLS